MTTHVRRLLLGFVHGELDEAKAKRVSLHLTGCADCRRRQQEIAAVAERLGALPRDSAPPELWAAVARATARERDVSSRRTGRIARPLALAAAAVFALLAGGLVWRSLRSGRSGWEVERTSGTPRIGAHPLGPAGTLRVGQWLSTDASSGARLSSNMVGEVVAGPRTRLRLLASRRDEQRLLLAEGTLEVHIWAPPRVFFVESPSATAIDLGCEYRMNVDENGSGLLHVTMGWVELEHGGIGVIVPVGAMCEIRAGRGPGTPFSEKTSASFRSALSRWDSDHDGKAFAELLGEATPADAITLWHLITQVAASQRETVYDRLAALVPPPPGVTRGGILEGNSKMLDAWWDVFGPEQSSWLRFWRESKSRSGKPAIDSPSVRGLHEK
jgi:Putative zinc-finger